MCFPANLFRDISVRSGNAISTKFLKLACCKIITFCNNLWKNGTFYIRRVCNFRLVSEVQILILSWSIGFEHSHRIAPTVGRNWTSKVWWLSQPWKYYFNSRKHQCKALSGNHATLNNQYAPPKIEELKITAAIRRCMRLVANSDSRGNKYILVISIKPRCEHSSDRIL